MHDESPFAGFFLWNYTQGAYVDWGNGGGGGGVGVSKGPAV